MKVIAVLFATAVLASAYPFGGYEYQNYGPYSGSMWNRLSSGYKFWPYSHETVAEKYYKPEEYVTKYQNFVDIIKNQHDFDFEKLIQHFDYLGEHEKLVFLKNILAVDITQRVLEQRQFTKQTTGSTYAQALAVAAAQQAFDECEKHGKPIFDRTCWTVAETIVHKVIEEAEFGQFFGSGSLYIHAVAVDAANRALSVVEHHGIDISNKFVRAVAIAVAQQALDKHVAMGHDIGSDDARTYAITVVQQILEEMFFKKYEHVQQYLNNFFGRFVQMPTYKGLYYSLFGKHFNYANVYSQEYYPQGYYHLKNYYQSVYPQENYHQTVYPQQYYHQYVVPQEYYHGINKDLYKTWFPTTRFYGLQTPTEFEYLNAYHHFYPSTEMKGLTVGHKFQKPYFGIDSDEKYYKNFDYKYSGKYDFTDFLKSYFGGYHYNVYPTEKINYEKSYFYPQYNYEQYHH